MLSNTYLLPRVCSPRFPHACLQQTQATIESLERATEGNPRHPLRQAFGDNYQSITRAQHCMKHSCYKFVQTALEHFCKMRQFAAPEFLRRLVAEGVQSNMPEGLIVQRVYLRAGTLSSVATGSDMVRVSFPELAQQLLGTGVSNHIKDQIKAIFSRAEVADSAEILEELDHVIEELPTLSLQDNTAKMAVKRLQEKMATLFGGTLPECPVTMDVIPKERVRILKCCTCVIDANVIAQCKGVCPLCRAPITNVGAVTEPQPYDKAARKRKSNSADADGQQKKRTPISPSLRRFVDSDDSDDSDDEEITYEETQAAKLAVFDATIGQISNDRPFSIDGIMRIMQAQVVLNPSSRMLLCFGFQPSHNRVVEEIMNRIRLEIDGSNVTDVDACIYDHQRMDEVKSKFDNPIKFPRPQIFVINTTESSSSVAGLDLFMTDLTIVADQCSLPIQRQAIGRSLRMRKRLSTMKDGEFFPAKRLIVASIGGAAPPPVAEEAEEEMDEDPGLFARMADAAGPP